MGTIHTRESSSPRGQLIPKVTGTLWAMPRQPVDDLTTAHGRLRHARKKKGLTVEDLAERTGINVNTVKKHEQRNLFDETDAKKYGRHLGVPWLWLLHAVEQSSKESLRYIPPRLGKTSQEVIDTDAMPPASGSELVTIREVDVVGGLGGGGEMPAAYVRGSDGLWQPSDAVAAEVMFPFYWLASLGLDPTRTDLIRVQGNSMSPEIEDGDWVFVDRRYQTLSGDDIYLIFDGTGLVVKALQLVRGTKGRDARRIRIISANPTYPIDEVPADDVTIIGRVRHRIGRIVRGR